MSSSIVDYLNKIEDAIDDAKTVRFSNKVAVDKNEVFEIIKEIRLNLPGEIRDAQRIIEDHDRIINSAKARAEDILTEAENEANSLVDEHEIFRRATERANDIIDEAKKTAKDTQLNSLDYADEILEKTEHIVKETLENMGDQFKFLNNFLTQTADVLYENRQSLRGR